MNKNKIFILTNPLTHEGGVVNYYNLFISRFESNNLQIKHGIIGSRTYLFYYPVLKRILYPLYFFYDLLNFVFQLIFDKSIRIVQVSPSLIPVPLIRDALLILITKVSGKKVVVFYRGWSVSTYSKISKSVILRFIFNSLFQKNTAQIVLATSFARSLNALGPKEKSDIMITTTAVDRKNVVLAKKKTDKDKIRILFLGRLEPLKGLEELIDSILLLKETGKLNDFQFTIAGHEGKGGYTAELKQRLMACKISSEEVAFIGRITGEEKYNAFSEHDVFVLPSHSEGCPNSVLEALSSGLFCITTSVGALEDIINDRNGILIRPKSSKDLFFAYNRIFENPSLLIYKEEIAAYALKRYEITKICADFEQFYTSLLKKKR